MTAISTSAFYQRAMRDLSALRSQAEGAQAAIGSGQRLTRSSDDPLAASQLRRLSRTDSFAAIDKTLGESVMSDLTLTDGTPEGRLTIKARNWQEILTMARSADLLSPALATQAKSVLGMLARAGGNPKTLDLPLDFKRGMLFIGPIPVAPAPRIFLR